MTSGNTGLDIWQAVLARDATRRFDGVICFGGEDWWYHNPGHYDMQMMRRLSRLVPVVFVNSLGMRLPAPREGRMFAHRVARKLRSLRRGFVRCESNLGVVSAPFVPGPLGGAARHFTLHAVRKAARRMGIRRALVWVACPTAAPMVDALASVALVYQRTDRYECFPGVNTARIGRLDRWLKARADLTVFCAQTLLDRERRQCTDACLIDHGVNAEAFERAAERGVEPDDVAALPRPRAGFIGAIDGHTFDAEFLGAVAERLTDVQFVLVGESTLSRRWRVPANVTLLGRKTPEQVPAYAAACDVLIMPWNRSPWIDGCHPVKLKEYLAAGRPVVSTPFAELQRYRGLVEVADTVKSFAAAVRGCLATPHDAAAGRRRARAGTWQDRADTLLATLADRRIEPAQATHGPIRAASPSLDSHSAPSVPLPAPPSLDSHSRLDSHPAGQAPLAACLLLAGGLRPSPLARAARRSILDLWLTPDRTVLDLWVDRVRGLDPALPVRVVHDASCPVPWPSGRVGVALEHDPQPFRGAAGLVRDLCRDYDPGLCVLVVESSRYPAVALDGLVDAVRTGADVAVAVNPDGSPAGAYLLRCVALRTVPPRGFMDLKEQWLPRLTDAGHDVRAVRLARPGMLRLHTRREFLAAARAANPSAGLPMRVVCAGGLIGPDAAVIDSVVMPGAVVASGSVVVRSVICPHTRTQPGAEIVDAVISTEGVLPARKAWPG